MALIMVIDDEELIRSVLTAILELEGHTVATFSGADEALRMLGTLAPDLVITDIVMPRKEGIELIVELRKSRPSLTIIAISGGGAQGGQGYLKIAGVLGAFRTLKKPFSRAEIIAAVNDALAARSG